jgi:RNA-directed DNA polymerase
MVDENARKRRKKRGDGNWRLVRYADDWVGLVTGTREHAVALQQRAAEVLASLGLRLSESKTKVTHLDEGIDFLGFRIQRKTKRGSEKRYTYTHRSAKARANIRSEVRERTHRATPMSPARVVISVNGCLRGWCNYFRHAVTKDIFGGLEWYARGRVAQFLRKRYRGLAWRDYKRRFVRNGTIIVDEVPDVCAVRHQAASGPADLFAWRHPGRGSVQIAVTTLRAGSSLVLPGDQLAPGDEFAGIWRSASSLRSWRT